MAKAYEEFKYTTDLASKIVKAMVRSGYTIDRDGLINIAYVEGMNPDGTINDNKPNVFNDLRTVLKISPEGTPILLGKWEGTTEPSKYWTENPMQPGGAARIQFGQYTAWKVGIHNGSHEALVQTGGPVTITRDENADYKRDGDLVQSGYFGINQHWGYDLPHDNLANSSAGCLVGRTKQGHREFMSIIKQDPRYKTDNSFVYTSCVLPARVVAG